MQTNAQVNRSSKPQLIWMINTEETVMLHFHYPLHIQLDLTNVPLYKVTVFFDAEELVTAEFRTNPADELHIQHRLACLCTEEIINKICDAVTWQNACLDFYRHCANNQLPSDEAIMQYMQYRTNLYGQVHLWNNTNSDDDDDDDE